MNSLNYLSQTSGEQLPTEISYLSLKHMRLRVVSKKGVLHSSSSGSSAIPKGPVDVDPFDTTFISPVDHQSADSGVPATEPDPFDTKTIDARIEEVGHQSTATTVLVKQRSPDGRVRGVELMGIHDYCRLRNGLSIECL